MLFSPFVADENERHARRADWVANDVIHVDAVACEPGNGLLAERVLADAAR